VAQKVTQALRTIGFIGGVPGLIVAYIAGSDLAALNIH
jgi:hypothetical protein